MRLKAAAVILAWCLIGWSGMVVAQEPISKADRAIWLVDDFEEQNLVGWTIPSGPCTASIAAVGAAGSNYSMVIDGACGHDGGTSYDLGGIQATSLSLYVKTTTTMNAHLYFILDDDSQATNGYILAFLATSSGWFSAFGAGAQYDLMPINSTDWHQLQFSIDWVGKNVDISINGVPRQYNLPFATDSISTLRQIHLYNLHDNTAWYDQIVLSTPPPSIMLMSDDFESADLSGWATSIPTLPLRLVIYSVNGVAGAIGGRPGADVLCGQGAQGLPGVPLHATTRAFLSVDATDSIANMPARYGVPIYRKVTGPNTTVIADNWADLLDGSIDTSLSDAGVMGIFPWYSGSGPDGSLDPDNCDGWTLSSGSAGRYGTDGSTTSTWISAGDAVCGYNLARILCLAWR